MDEPVLLGDKKYRKSDLPIYEVADDLLWALRKHNRVILCAPPGAGKTTAIPIEVLKARLNDGKIIILQPRRLAARAAADRMAAMLNQTVGETVGYRMKGNQKISLNTKIEVVTEGILTRMIQNDPELTGIGTIIFDEFHERSLNTDLGLAFSLEIAAVLRKDLYIIVMSATLEADAISKLLSNAPIIHSEGKRFPVNTIWLDRPRSKEVSFETGMKELVLKGLREQSGGMLAFLPGELEIKTLAAMLKNELDSECDLHLLYGAMPFHQQHAAIKHQKKGRKVVLATSIAETSLTIEDIQIVVDGGKTRRLEFDAASGMQQLITTNVSKHQARQRTGRAGRTAPGSCYRFWSLAEEGSLSLSSPAEMDVADLSSLALDLALWGTKADNLSFLSYPKPERLQQAKNLLQKLDAIGPDGRITNHGKEVAKLPLHPRLGHLLIMAGKNAAYLTALLNEKDPLPSNAPKDFSMRLELLTGVKKFINRYSVSVNIETLGRIKDSACHLERIAPVVESKLTPAQMLALAYPDRIGQLREGQTGRFLLSGGMGAHFKSYDLLENSNFIVAPQLDGNKKDAGIRLAASITETEIRDLFSADILKVSSCLWSKRKKRVITLQEEKLGAISLTSHFWKDAPKNDIASALLKGIRQIGLFLSDREKIFLSRLATAGKPYSEISEARLLETLEIWLLPYLEGLTTAKEWKALDKLPALRGIFSYEQMQDLDKKAPISFTTTSGRKIPIHYGNGQAEISVEVKELFGQKTHPTIGEKPLLVTLLSPARRPLQSTTNLPRFWETSYYDVRKEMRGRYPKHPWPENPAEKFLRSKPRESK